MRKPPVLLTQVLAVNTLLIVATVFAASVAARLDLNHAAGLHQFLVLIAAILATVLANNVLMRRRFAPLESLTRTMECVELAVPGRRAHPAAGEPADVSRLRQSFNLMLDRLEAERSGTAKAVLRAQESERARVARDLHDEVNQALTAVSLRLAATAERAPPELSEELAETQRLAGQAMQELLGLARELRPAALDDHGLIPALRTQVRLFGERHKIDANFAADGPRPLLGETEMIVAYRVVQEALNNAANHGKPEHVTVKVLGCNSTRISITIQDDGCGFLLHQANGSGSGLRGMRERAMLVNGQLEVRSAPGAGTTTELTLRTKGTQAR